MLEKVLLNLLLQAILAVVSYHSKNISEMDNDADVDDLIIEVRDAFHSWMDSLYSDVVNLSSEDDAS